jgi:hypothetical protein
VTTIKTQLATESHPSADHHYTFSPECMDSLAEQAKGLPVTSANRHQPRRARSSESTYSLMEFMREFPDDAACLEHLWRETYSPDGEHAECPKCKQERVFRKYKTAQGRQSWTTSTVAL